MKILNTAVLSFVLLSFAVFAQHDATDYQNSKTPRVRAVEVEPGVFLEILDYGGKDKQMLFLPSWHHTAHIYDDFAPRFTDNFQVAAMSLRGHGGSSRPDHGYSIDTLTHDILVVLDSLDFDQVTLVGLSRSASLLNHFAVRYPDRINALIYLSGSIDRPFQRKHFPKVFRTLRSLRCPSMTREDSTSLSTFSAWNERRRGYRWPLAEIRAVSRFDDRGRYIGPSLPPALGRAWRDSDPSPPYGQIRTRALAFFARRTTPDEWFNMLCGELLDGGQEARLLLEQSKREIDSYFKHHVKLFQNEMRNGTAIEISGASYHTFLSHPDLVEQKIRSFISSR